MFNNINATQEQKSVTTLEKEHSDVNVDYGALVKGAAITGAIAGAATVGGEWIEGYTGSKPTFEKGADEAVYKEAGNELGTLDLTANNIGMANTLPKGSAQIGNIVENPGLVNEGGWISKVCNNIGGCNSGAVFHVTLTNKIPIFGTIGLNQLSITPAIGVNYCTLAPSLCTVAIDKTINNK